MTDFDTYQDQTEQTAIYPDELPDCVDDAYALHRLRSIVLEGQKMGHLKKAIREDEESYLVESVDVPHNIHKKDIPEWVDARELYCAIGIVDEAAEIVEKILTAIAEDDPSIMNDISKEQGDVLWYLARLSDERGDTLDGIAEANMDKLLDRKDRDVLEGQGDAR